MKISVHDADKPSPIGFAGDGYIRFSIIDDKMGAYWFVITGTKTYLQPRNYYAEFAKEDETPIRRGQTLTIEL